MDPRDRLRLRLVGTGCGACGSPYAATGISVLAQREDLAFVLLHCAACGSDGLGLVTDGEPDEAVAPGAGGAEASPPRHAMTFSDLTPGDRSRLRDAPPISVDDVLAVHELLDGHRGDLRTLVEGSDRRPGRS